MKTGRKRFRVALSFAGEKRSYVARLASLLAQRLGQGAILYDKYHEAEFARHDLGFYLPGLYHYDSDLVVVVICRDYDSKEWCGLEWDAIFDLLKQRKNDDVMLCRFERASVKGLYSTAGFLDLDHKSEEETTARILERLALNEGKEKSYYSSTIAEFDHNVEPQAIGASTSDSSVEARREIQDLLMRELTVLDFAPRLEEKRQNFIGRKWLFDEVADWMSSGTEPALLITGDPGVGKSAFVAEMIYRNPDDILAYHICSADDPETLQPSALIRNLAGMIAKELPGFASMIAEVRFRHLFDSETINEKPAHVFEHGVIAALRELPAPPRSPRCIVIDGLDEALPSSSAVPNIPALLSSQTERLPRWVRLIATTRNDADVLNRLSTLRAKRIDAQGQNNLHDIDAFLAMRLASSRFATLLSSSAISLDLVRSKLRTSADGNFLYASQALKDIERGRYSFERLDELPDGIHGIYLSFFERSFPSSDSFIKCRRVLEVNLAAQQPIPVLKLAEIAELESDYELSHILSKLSVFIQRLDQGIRLYHKSLADWLTSLDPTAPHRFYVSITAGHARLARFLQGCLVASFVADHNEARKGQRVPGSEPEHSTRHLATRIDENADVTYALSHLPSHLRSAGRLDDLLKLLSSYRYVAARVAYGQTHGLIKDIQLTRQQFGSQSVEADFLSFLEQALSRNSYFLHRTRHRYEQGTFQSVVNLLSFSLTPNSAQDSYGLTLLTGLLESWHKEFRPLGLPWMRALRPPDLAVGVDQCAVFTEHQAEVRHLAVSHDGTLLLSAGDDGMARMHDTSSGEVLHSWPLGGRKVVGICFLESDSQIVAFACSERDVESWGYRWHAKSGELQASVRFPGITVRCCGPVTGSASVVIGTDQGVYRIVLDPVIHEMRLADSERISVDFYPERIVTGMFTSLLALANKKEIRIYDTATGSWKGTFSCFGTHDISAVAISHHGDRVAMATWSGWAHDVSIRIFAVESGCQLGQVRHTSENWSNSVEFSASSMLVASGTSCGQVRLWDWDSLQLRAEYDGHESYVVALCASPGDGRIYSAGTDGRVLAWGTDRKCKQTARIGHEGKIYSLSVSDDERLVASGDEMCQLFVWDWMSGNVVFSAECLHFVDTIVFSGDGSHIATLGSEDGNMQMWNVKRRRELWHRRGEPYSDSGAPGERRRVSDPVSEVAFSPNDDAVACIEGRDNEACALVIRNLSNGVERDRIEGGSEIFTKVAFSAGGRIVAVGARSGIIQLWSNQKPRRLVATLEGIEDWIVAVAFHPHKQSIIAASDVGEVAMWRSERRRWERVWHKRAADSAERFVFASDGEQVALIRYFSKGVSIYDYDSGGTVVEESAVSSPWHLFRDSGERFVANASEEETTVRSHARSATLGVLPFGLKMLKQNRDGKLIAGVKGRQLHLYHLEIPNDKSGHVG